MRHAANINDVKNAQDLLAGATRIVVKVGSAILCGPDGAVNEAWLKTLASDIAAQRSQGREIVIVTSGAIALGRERLGLGGKLRLDEKQAASAAGQIALAEAWQAAFSESGVKIGQVLLTLEDNEARRRYLNARATVNTLLELGALPLINENDTIATAEIRYGDNDRLAAHVAQLVGADALLLLSDIDGLYTADPRKVPDAQRIDVVDEVTPAIEEMAKGPNASAGVGSGGMETKIAAARIAAASGCATIIAPGLVDHPLAAVTDGGPSTLIRAGSSRESARKQWIAGRIAPVGAIEIDAGALQALGEGASLLPAGVTHVEGAFSRGDTVRVIGPEGQKLGQGLITFDAPDLDAVKGKRSSAIESVLGYRRRPVVIERNDLVLHKNVKGDE